MSFDTEMQLATQLEIDGVIVACADIITMRGLESIASCLGSPFTYDKAWMPFIAIGQGEVAPSTEDRFLENEKYRKEGAVSAVDNRYIIEATFGITEPSEEMIVREVGILNEYANGLLGARWVLDSDLYKYVGDSVVVTCKIYIA